MKAVVLVGGEGTRLRPLTIAAPKPMLPVANRAFVERTLDRLEAVGCDEVVLSTCYRSEAFDHLEPRGSMVVRQVVEEIPLGTGGAIGYAGSGFAETFLVLNGDILTDLDLSALVQRHRTFGGEATIVLTPVEDPSRFGVVPTDASGRVVEFVEKPAPGTAPTNMINAGTYVCEPAILKRIPSGRPVSVEREIFPAMASEGVLYAVASDAYWLDFGTHATYLQANLDTLDGSSTEPVPGEEVAEGIWLGRGAEIAPGAALEAPVVIGERATVGAEATVGPLAVVGPEVVVGDGTTITSSVLLEGAVVGAGARLDGVIVGTTGVVASGAVLGRGSVIPPGAVS